MWQPTHNAWSHGSGHQRGPSGFIIGPWTDNGHTHVNGKKCNYTFEFNKPDLRQVYYMSPDRIKLSNSGGERVLQIVWIKWNGWAIPLVVQNTYWILRWAVKQIWRPNLGHYLIATTMVSLASDFVWNFKLSEITKGAPHKPLWMTNKVPIHQKQGCCAFQLFFIFWALNSS